MVVEVTLVRFGLFFNFDYSVVFLQVIWAIGWSMVVLAGLVFLPSRAVLAVGVVLIAGHNLLDGMGPTPYASITTEYGFSLGGAYLVRVGVVLALYLPCRWFAALKARRTEAWLSYL